MGQRADQVWTFPAAAAASPYTSALDLGHTDLLELRAPALEAGTGALVLQVSRDGGTTWTTATKTPLDGTGTPIAVPASAAAATVVRFEPWQLLSLGLCRWWGVDAVATLVSVNQNGQVVRPLVRNFG